MIDDLILRIVANAPLTTKGSELTFEEVDGNWIEIYNEFLGLNNALNVGVWDSGNSYYTGEFVLYNSRLYKALQGAIPGDNSAETPDAASSAFWSKVSAGQLFSSPGLEPVPSYTLVQLAEMKAESRLIVGGRYRLTDYVLGTAEYPMILIANTTSTFHSNAISEDASDIVVEFDSSDVDSSNWIVTYIKNEPLALSLSDTTKYNAVTHTLSIGATDRHVQEITLSVDAWAAGTTYAEDDIVLEGGQVYISLVNGNTGNDPDGGGSPGYWSLLNGDGIPKIEIINDLSSTHDTQFEVSGGISVLIVATTAATATDGKIILDLNTDVTITDKGYLKLRDKSGINRYAGGGLLI